MPVRVRWWHQVDVLIGCDPVEKFTVDTEDFLSSFTGIEAQISLDGFFVWSVAVVAIASKNRADVAIEGQLFFGTKRLDCDADNGQAERCGERGRLLGAGNHTGIIIDLSENA